MMSANVSRILIPKTEVFSQKSKKLIEGGVNKLQILIDFDRTITSFIGPNGLQGMSCHGIIEHRRSEEVRRKAKNCTKCFELMGSFSRPNSRGNTIELNDYYYAIEVDHNMTLEEKIPYMVKWYQSINEVLQEANILRSDLAEDVATANFKLRDNIADVFLFAEEHGIPVTIFSAGVGDVIYEVLRNKLGYIPHCLRIVANWMTWECSTLSLPTPCNGISLVEAVSVKSRPHAHHSTADLLKADISTPVSVASTAISPMSISSPKEVDTVETTLPTVDDEETPIADTVDGLRPKIPALPIDCNHNAIGWSDPLIHMYNKNSSHMHGHRWLDELSTRPHALLIGDSPGDTTMADGLPTEVVLRYAFVNSHVEKNIPRYESLFDVLITNDGPAEPILDLLKEIQQFSSKI